MIVYLLAGLTILGICKFFEQKHKVKKAYLNFKNYVSKNKQCWEITSNEIIQTHNSQSIEVILGKGVDIYLIEKKESGLKIYALNNEKIKDMLELQYNGILKKFGEQDMFYTFHFDTGSVYYRFAPPYENYILWIYIC
jgi:hypothetical protein